MIGTELVSNWPFTTLPRQCSNRNTSVCPARSCSCDGCTKPWSRHSFPTRRSSDLGDHRHLAVAQGARQALAALVALLTGGRDRADGAGRSRLGGGAGRGVHVVEGTRGPR